MGKYQRQTDETNEADASTIPIVQNKQTKKKCFGDGFKVLIIGCIIFCTAITIGLFVDIYYLRKPLPRSAVVTADPECTKIASDILEKNDNAIDAAIGAMICLAVVKPDQCSLASGGYMLFHSANADKSLDFQFAAPKDVKNGKDEVAIPGLLSGLQSAHKLYGSLPFPKLVEPSIELASKGFVVSNSTADNLKKLSSSLQKKIFGKLVEGGEKIKLTKLSQTLTGLINGNYSLADDIIKALASQNGSMTQNDFEKYKPVWRKPLNVVLKDQKILSTYVPSTGVLLLSALQVLNMFPKMNASYSTAVTAADLQIMFGEVAALQDPAFDPHELNITKQILSTSGAKYSAQEIKQIVGFSRPGKKSKSVTNETTSSATVSIINLKGDAVSIVSSLGDLFGSKIVTDGGVILNNGLSLFVAAGQRNKLEAYKRPISFAAPSFMIGDGAVRVFTPSVGKEGLASALQVMKNILFDSMGDEEAVKYPRVFYDTKKGEVLVEAERFASDGLQNVTSILKSCFTIRDVESIGSVDVAFKQETLGAIQDTR